ncbi:hypothetical protein CLOLEP_01044 [[Clostridium] leptum DSM 753]|uniref:Uncharacterized protein n=1 Tax=[Clostridium] leptum DSM 753 TaxID=428125 RepID=A7VR61_9FIRM|nr:hypothetical protein CLOLEP_01044 [[Clostridium] leptum DSM 753]
MQADNFRAGTASAAGKKNKPINKMRNLHKTPRGPGQKRNGSFVPGLWGFGNRSGGLMGRES